MPAGMGDHEHHPGTSRDEDPDGSAPAGCRADPPRDIQWRAAEPARTTGSVGGPRTGRPPMRPHTSTRPVADPNILGHGPPIIRRSLLGRRRASRAAPASGGALIPTWPERLGAPVVPDDQRCAGLGCPTEHPLLHGSRNRTDPPAELGRSLRAADVMLAVGSTGIPVGGRPPTGRHPVPQRLIHSGRRFQAVIGVNYPAEASRGRRVYALAGLATVLCWDRIPAAMLLIPNFRTACHVTHTREH